VSVGAARRLEATTGLIEFGDRARRQPSLALALTDHTCHGLLCDERASFLQQRPFLLDAIEMRPCHHFHRFVRTGDWKEDPDVVRAPSLEKSAKLT
jgi:hypothetical protein